VVISRFTSRSTFIVRELQELLRCGARLRIVSLRRPEAADLQWAAESLPGAEIVYRPYVFDRAIPTALLYFAFRRPATLLALVGRIIVGSARQPLVLIKTLAVVPKGMAEARVAVSRRFSRLHAHWATVSASAGFIISELASVPFSFTAHAWDIYMDDSLHGLKLRKADLVICCSRYGRQTLLARNGAGFGAKVLVVHHGLDTSEFRPASPARTDPLLILAVGRLTEHKGFQVLLEACRELRSRAIPFHCRIVGSDGDAGPSLRRLVREGDLEAQVDLLDFVTPERMPQIFQEAAVVVVPTVIPRRGGFDGLPNVVLEAMACGVPVIGSNLVGIPEAVEDGGSGYLVPPGDPRALAAAIERILRSPEERARLGSRGRQLAERDFDLRQSGMSVYRLLCGQPGR
jgi:glycosyltransferase involved in cell wall biosynthesis